MKDDTHRVRLTLAGFTAIMLATGWALAAIAGPPRVPPLPPTPEAALNVLLGPMLPVDALVTVLVDATWLLWSWVILSLLLQLGILLAEILDHGRRWVRPFREVADRLTLPLVRRGVAAAFAVQVISRGVTVAAAQPLPPVETVVSSEPEGDDTIAAPGVPGESSDATTYLVRPGDTLWSIAERAYGSGTEYRKLVDANIGRRMPDGQTFSARGVIQPGWRLVAPGATWTLEEADGQRWYTVRPGDTLSSIAESILGDRTRWTELFELNRGLPTPDGRHTLEHPNTIWPDMRLRLPGSPAEIVETDAPTEGTPSVGLDSSADLLVASAPSPVAFDGSAIDPSPEPTPAPIAVPPLVRTQHAFQPVVLDRSDTAADPTDPSSEVPAAASSSGGDANLPLPNGALRGDLPVLPIALGGLGLAGLAGAAIGAGRLRKLKPLPQEPESDTVVQGGFAEAQLAHDLTRGLHGVAFDPVTALVGQLEQFLAEYALTDVGIVAVRHGRSSTTVTLRSGLAEQPVLLDLASVFAGRLGAEAEVTVSADQDVIVRLVRLRKTRLLPSAASSDSGPCVVPLGVLYDRQVYAATCRSLGHVLVASLPGHGADAILTSLIATLTARRSPAKLDVWLLALPRALPEPLFGLPHLARVVDPADQSAMQIAVQDLRAELDSRNTGDHPELLVVIPELGTLGAFADELALVAAHAADVGVRFIGASSSPDEALASPLTPHFGTRMVLRMQSEEASVALLGVADAAFLGGGGRLLLRLDGREPLELYGYHVSPEHLERLVRVMRSAYLEPRSSSVAPVPPSDPESPTAPPAQATTPGPDPAQRLENQAAPAELPCTVEEVTSVVAPIQVTCFGAPRVECAGQVVWPRNGGDAKPWEFLLFLACQPEDGATRDAVIAAMWPDHEDLEDAGHRFRQLRYRLRRQLQAVPGAPNNDGICFDRRQLRLDPGVVYSDAQEFLTQIRAVRLNPGLDAIERLERARALYIGDLLAGPDARRYAWLDERDDSGVTLREHFRRLFQNASIRLAELYTADGVLDPAIELYRELTDIDPADERLWQSLFRLHAQRGDRQSLVQEEQRLRRILRELAEELDVPGDEPSSELTEEFKRLLAGLREREPAAV